jgi:hypothetical protein
MKNRREPEKNKIMKINDLGNKEINWHTFCREAIREERDS